MVLLELLEPEPEPEGQLWVGELVAGQGQGQPESRLPELEQAHQSEAQIPFDFRRKLEEGLEIPLGLISSGAVSFGAGGFVTGRLGSFSAGVPDAVLVTVGLGPVGLDLVRTWLLW
uniref:Uncharacterized protein n=1 Tax=Fusarium oxysporum (strain Fo5176) TaxID=660025 RepID=A0A0D2Y7Q0_FUSOF